MEFDLHSTIFILKLKDAINLLPQNLFTFYNIYIKTLFVFLIRLAYRNLHSTIFILKQVLKEHLRFNSFKDSICRNKKI